jgi:hypothetical protein
MVGYWSQGKLYTRGAPALFDNSRGNKAMKEKIWVAFVVTMILILCPVFATAAEPFIKAELYKTQGTALSLESFAQNPRIYYRSEQAFQSSRQYAERVIDSSLTDVEFIALLQSDRVRTKACSGEVTTGGLLLDDYHWFQRQCYQHEEIVQVKVGGRWVDLLSLACLNPIEDKSPQLETVVVDEGDVEPPSENCRWVAETETRHESGQVFINSPIILAGCSNCCNSGAVVVGGGSYQMPSDQIHSTLLRRVCSK